MAVVFGLPAQAAAERVAVVGGHPTQPVAAAIAEINGGGPVTAL